MYYLGSTDYGNVLGFPHRRIRIKNTEKRIKVPVKWLPYLFIIAGIGCFIREVESVAIGVVAIVIGVQLLVRFRDNHDNDQGTGA